MLQKLKVTSYAFLYFLMFGFSFIALQVTTEEVEAAVVCIPNERIQVRDGGGWNPTSYNKAVDKCASQPQGGCETVGWGKGRCAMSSEVDTVAAQDIIPNQDRVNDTQISSDAVCHPNARITVRYNTIDHASYEIATQKCAAEGVNVDTCATGWGKGRCQWGSPPDLGPIDSSRVARSRSLLAYDTCKALHTHRVIMRSMHV